MLQTVFRPKKCEAFPVHNLPCGYLHVIDKTRRWKRNTCCSSFWGKFQTASQLASDELQCRTEESALWCSSLDAGGSVNSDRPCLHMTQAGQQNSKAAKEGHKP